MSEAAISAAIITAIKNMSEFADADVVDNDYSILDQSVLKAPYVIVGTSDEFVSRQDVQTANTTWDLPITLIENFDGWATTLINIRTRRQALIDKINSGDIRSAGGLSGIDIHEIRSAGPLEPVFPPYVESEDFFEASPIYIYAAMILICEEF